MLFPEYSNEIGLNGSYYTKSYTKSSVKNTLDFEIIKIKLKPVKNEISFSLILKDLTTVPPNPIVCS